MYKRHLSIHLHYVSQLNQECGRCIPVSYEYDYIVHISRLSRGYLYHSDWWQILSSQMALINQLRIVKCGSRMMTSSNGNIFSVTGPLFGEFTGHRRIPYTKASNSLMFHLICAWIDGWANNREDGDLRRHRAHYDVIVMWKCKTTDFFQTR